MAFLSVAQGRVQQIRRSFLLGNSGLQLLSLAPDLGGAPPQLARRATQASPSKPTFPQTVSATRRPRRDGVPCNHFI